MGIIRCKGRNKVVAEYAMRGISQPLGVSSFGLADALPAGLEGSLPSVEQLEREFAGLEGGAGRDDG